MPMLTRKNHILITGVESGLGKQCLHSFNGIGFSRKTRWNEIQTPALEKPYDAIIHAAFNTQPPGDNSNLYTYLNDTILLTQKLKQIPHKKFIFISSVDVYPKLTDRMHSEDENINIQEVKNIYGVFKLISESIIKNETENNLILRPTVLLGPFAKKNSLIRMLSEKNISLTLAGDSTFNYVLHDDLCRFIEYAIAKDLKGIYNLAVSSNISLAMIAKIFNTSVTFGSYTYTTGHIMNSKVTSIFSDLDRSSLDSVYRFYKPLGM